MTVDNCASLSIETFESGDLDPSSFDHSAHIRVAWLYLARYDPPEAIARFTAALKRLTVDLGVPQKYHETISWFYLLLIAERRHDSGDDWQGFLRHNGDLFSRGRDVLNRYYSGKTLASDQARRSFVLPDRIGPASNRTRRR